MSNNFEKIPIKKIQIDIYFIEKFFKSEHSGIFLNLLPEHLEENAESQSKKWKSGRFSASLFFALLSMTRLARSTVNRFNRLEPSFLEKFDFEKIISSTNAP